MAFERHLGAEVRGGLLEHLTHVARLVLDDVLLLEQDHLLVELAQPALDHLLDRSGRLARRRRLLGRYSVGTRLAVSSQ